MAKFATESNSVSHGPDEFFAVDGVVEIPDDKAALFADFVAGGLLAPVTEEPVEQVDDKADETPKAGSAGSAGKGKKAKS